MAINNILHVASFTGNIGDNANHRGLRHFLSSTLSKELTYTELEMREFYQSWNLKNFNSKAFVDMCNSHDLVIIGGGNFFELKWDYSATGTTINLHEETLDQIETPIFFFGLGCDIAKGASDETISKFKSFFKYITDSSKCLVTVRNDGSKETIEKLYGTQFDDKYEKVLDGAFLTTLNDGINHNWFPQKLKTVGINIVADMKDIRFNGTASYHDFIDELSIVINDFLTVNDDYQLLLFPHIYSDYEAISLFLNRINDNIRRNRVVVAPYLTGERSDEHIFNLYKQCRLVLGMRFHSNVCSLVNNIPIIPLSSYKKIDDLYNDLNLTDKLVDVRNKGFSQMLKKEIDDILDKPSLTEKHFDILNKKIDEEKQFLRERFLKWLGNV